MITKIDLFNLGYVKKSFRVGVLEKIMRNGILVFVNKNMYIPLSNYKLDNYKLNLQINNNYVIIEDCIQQTYIVYGLNYVLNYLRNNKNYDKKLNELSDVYKKYKEKLYGNISKSR